MLATSPTKALGYVVTGSRDGQARDTATATTTAATASASRRRRSSPLHSRGAAASGRHDAEFVQPARAGERRASESGLDDPRTSDAEVDPSTRHAYAVEDLVSERTRDLMRKRRFGRTRAARLADQASAGDSRRGRPAARVRARQLVVRAGRPPRYDGSARSSRPSCSSAPAAVASAGARLRLYDRDEARTDHSSVDDMVGIFNMVTVGAWGFFALAWLTGFAHPQSRS